MIGRTMSHLFLTVVAAAVFLVSGCGPQHAESPNMQSAVDTAVAEAVAKEVNPSNLAKKIAEVIEEDPDLREVVINSLCNNSVRLQLVDVEEEFVKAILDNAKGWPEHLQPKHLLSKKSGTTYHHYYENLSVDQFNDIQTKIRHVANQQNGEQVVLDKKDAYINCDLLDKTRGALVYVSVRGAAIADTERKFTLSIQLQFVNPYKGESRVWFVPQRDHWLSKLTSDDVTDDDVKERIDSMFGTRARSGVEITGDQSAGGTWKRDGNTWTWKVSGDLNTSPTRLLKRGPNAMYAMIARKINRSVAGEEKTFRIVQYRKFQITSPAGTFSDQPIKLENVLAQPACPPSEIKRDADTERAFRGFLKDAYGPKQCKEG